MDDIGKWNQYLAAQLPSVRPDETELIMGFTIPISADCDVFRVGWDLRRPSKRSWVAISTGLATWERADPGPAARHITALLEECTRMLEGHQGPRL